MLAGKTAFSAYQSVLQSVSASTWTKVTFTTESFDKANNYDNTNSKFVAPEAGVYFFKSSVGLASVADTKSIGVALYINGVQATVEFQRPGVGNSLGSQTAALFNLAANDYVEVYVWHDNGSSVNTTNAAINTYFSGFYVRT